MIFFQGIDIVENYRIEKIYKRFGSNFINKILDNKEINYLPKRNKNLINYLSGRFAAKEAVSKALGKGFRDGIIMKEFIIINNKLGKPEVEFKGRAQKHLEKIFNNKDKLRVSLTISHEKKFTIALATFIDF